LTFSREPWCRGGGCVSRAVASTAGFVNRAGHQCGVIPSNTIVVVVDRQPTEKPSFSRIYRPADPYLNGECTDADGYYIEQDNLVAL
jgi:hypothetical protein